jgi:hypothetical protein
MTITKPVRSSQGEGSPEHRARAVGAAAWLLGLLAVGQAGAAGLLTAVDGDGPVHPVAVAGVAVVCALSATGLATAAGLARGSLQARSLALGYLAWQLVAAAATVLVLQEAAALLLAAVALLALVLLSVPSAGRYAR